MQTTTRGWSAQLNIYYGSQPLHIAEMRSKRSSHELLPHRNLMCCTVWIILVLSLRDFFILYLKASVTGFADRISIWSPCVQEEHILVIKVDIRHSPITLRTAVLISVVKSGKSVETSQLYVAVMFKSTRFKVSRFASDFSIYEINI